MTTAAPSVASRVATIDSPLGPLRVVTAGGVVARVVFTACAGASDPGAGQPEGDPLGLAPRLTRWFAGDLRALEDVPLAAPVSDFQRDVRALLRTVPPGTTTTYGELAARLGQPRAARAVGSAVGANPLALLVPCHRVLASGGGAGGYAWGIERKQWLLAHEAWYADPR